MTKPDIHGTYFGIEWTEARQILLLLFYSKKNPAGYLLFLHFHHTTSRVATPTIRKITTGNAITAAVDNAPKTNNVMKLNKKINFVFN